MRVCAIVQARMGSTRLPGKVLIEVLGRPLLAYLVERLRRARSLDEVVIATSTKPQDDAIADFCARLPVACFRGDEDDVLGRYYAAALEHRADLIVRVTGDCPLIDPEVVDRCVEAFLEHQPDYASNIHLKSYPLGISVEVVSIGALAQAFEEATAVPDREHVTPFVHRRPDRFTLHHVVADVDHSQHRWTVDTPEDLDLVSRLLEALYPGNPRFTMDDCLAVLERHPEWIEINRHVHQKAYGE